MCIEEKRTALLVGMEPATSARVGSSLGNLGWQAASLAEENVLVRVLEEAPDLVVLEIGALGAATLEVLPQMKSWCGTRPLPVVVVSPHAELRLPALRAGADAFLVSPPDAEELAAVAENLWDVRLAFESLRDELSGLRERTELKDSLFLMAVHDFKGPITGIVNCLELIEDTSRTRAQPREQDYIRLARRSCQTLMDMVRDVQNLSRLEEGTYRLRPVMLDVGSCVEESLQSIGAPCASRSVSVSLETTRDLPRIRGDVRLVGRILDNLLQNALRHTREGGKIVVRVEPEPPLAGVRVSVENSGDPIQPKLKEKMFQMFETGLGEEGDPSRLGVGLAFCRLAVRAHGGDIWSQSPKAFDGAGFVFTLPGRPMALGGGGETDTELRRAERAAK
jgi:signal transduction histidine kinase